MCYGEQGRRIYVPVIKVLISWYCQAPFALTFCIFVLLSVNLISWVRRYNPIQDDNNYFGCALWCPIIVSFCVLFPPAKPHEQCADSVYYLAGVYVFGISSKYSKRVNRLSRIIPVLLHVNLDYHCHLL